MKIGMIALTAAFLMLAAPAWAGPSDPCGGSPDTDGDGVCDVLDNCSAISNVGVGGCDTDNDGYGNMCDADYDNTGTVAPPDFTVFIFDFTGTGLDGGTGTDMDCSTVVAPPDFNLFIAQFTGSGLPGPSGLSCAGSVGCGASAGN